MVISGHTSLSFAGNSYIKYRVSENSKKEEFKLALRLRTLQSNGIIMYTRANPCIILKVIKISLCFPAVIFLDYKLPSRWALAIGNAMTIFSCRCRNLSVLSFEDNEE